MSGATTPNVADNLKSGAAEAWGVLADNIKNWNSDSAKAAGLPNPFVRKTSVQNTAYELKDQINEASGFKTAGNNRKNGSKANATPLEKTAYDNNNPASSNTILNNRENAETEEETYFTHLHDQAITYMQQIDAFYYQYMYDPKKFAEETLPLFGENPEFEDVYYEYTNFIDDNPGATTDQHYEFLRDYLRRFE